MRHVKIYSRVMIVVTALFMSACAGTSHRLKNPDGTNSLLQLQTYLIEDGKKAAPTVLIGHGSGGVTPNHHEWAKTINGWGYHAVVIDHYTLRGISRHTGQVAAGATTKDRARDFADVTSWVKTQPWHAGNMALIGYSQGGGGMLAYVNHRVMSRLGRISDGKEPVVAAIGFYPACFLESPVDEPRMPVLMILGEKDDLARPEFCLPLNNPLYSVHIMPNATHSFDEHIPSTVRLSFTQRYSGEAVAKSQFLVKEFLVKYLN